MLYLLLSFIILLPVFAGVGAGLKRFLGTAIKGLAGQIFTGILGVTVTFSVIAFFFPLTVWVEIAAVAVGFFSFFFFKSYIAFKDFYRRNKPEFYLLPVSVLFFGSGYPFILDHFGYYVPSIKWISEVGLVQGISNLDLVLGQMSFWHILQAGFSHFSDPFMRLNAVMLAVYGIYIFEKKAWSHLLLFPVFYLFVQAPSPDLPAIVFSLVGLQEILNKNKSYGWLFAFSVFAFAIKPTLIWLPLFSFFYIISTGMKIFPCLIGGALVGVLFMFKNCWTFGFPVFPVQVVDFGLGWKPHADILQISSDVATRKTFDMQYTVAEIKNFSRLQWVNAWFTLPFPKGWINLFLILSLLTFLVFCFLKKQKIWWLLLLALIAKTVLVLVFSAQYRFFLDVFFVLAAVLFYKKLKKSTFAIFNITLSLALLVMISFPQFVQKSLPNFRIGSFMTGFSIKQVIMPAVFKLEKYQTHQIGNLTFNIVEAYYYSFDTPLPAITPYLVRKYHETGIFPQLKGKTLKDGFVWKKLSQSDRIKLEKIIRDMHLEKYGN